MSIIIAGHMTEYVEGSAFLTVGLFVLALIITAALYRTWRMRLSVAAGVLLFSLAALSAVNTTRLHHVHLCHEHSADSCPVDHDGPDDHVHWLGRWPFD